MDAADAQASDGVMIAFLPTTTDWCRQELPHMTLVYAGTKDQLQPGDFNSLAKDAASIALLYRPFMLEVTHLDVFGDADNKVDVLRFRLTPELMAARRMVERWNKSEHPFQPHATIGPVNGLPIAPPRMVGFNQIIVGWGEESLTFKL